MIATISACSQSSRTDEPGSINELANQLEPELNRGWDEGKASMQAEAGRCGTSIVFHDDAPVIVNDKPYVWWIAPSATAEQVACVHRTYPELPVAPK